MDGIHTKREYIHTAVQVQQAASSSEHSSEAVSEYVRHMPYGACGERFLSQVTGEAGRGPCDLQWRTSACSVCS